MFAGERNVGEARGLARRTRSPLGIQTGRTVGSVLGDVVFGASSKKANLRPSQDGEGDLLIMNA